MAISFIRVDDRMIHGQTCTRWALEYPCDGLIAVNNAAAKNPVLKSAYKSASGKKTFVWSVEEFQEKTEKEEGGQETGKNASRKPRCRTDQVKGSLEKVGELQNRDKLTAAGYQL